MELSLKGVAIASGLLWGCGIFVASSRYAVLTTEPRPGRRAACAF